MHPQRQREKLEAAIRSAERAAYLIDSAQAEKSNCYARVLLAEGLHEMELGCMESQRFGGKNGPHYIELFLSILGCDLLDADDISFLTGRVLGALFLGTGLSASEQSRLTAIIKDVRSVWHE